MFVIKIFRRFSFNADRISWNKDCRNTVLPVLYKIYCSKNSSTNQLDMRGRARVRKRQGNRPSLVRFVIEYLV